MKKFISCSLVLTAAVLALGCDPTDSDTLGDGTTESTDPDLTSNKDAVESDDSKNQDTSLMYAMDKVGGECYSDTQVFPDTLDKMNLDDYTGLSCLLWQTQNDNTLGVALINNVINCSADYELTYEWTNDDNIDLTLTNQGGEATCSCTGNHVFQFKKDFDGLDTLQLKFTFDNLPRTDMPPPSEQEIKDSMVTLEVDLPIGTDPSGAICNEFLYRYEDHVGVENTPCVDYVDSLLTEIECEAGLDCVDINAKDDFPRCVAPCETDDTCNLSVNQKCVDGHCIFETVW